MKFVYSDGTFLAADDCKIVDVPDDITDAEDIEEYCEEAEGVELDAILAKVYPEHV